MTVSGSILNIFELGERKTTESKITREFYFLMDSDKKTKCSFGTERKKYNEEI